MRFNSAAGECNAARTLGIAGRVGGADGWPAVIFPPAGNRQLTAAGAAGLIWVRNGGRWSRPPRGGAGPRFAMDDGLHEIW
jgi:hypothetical protein